MNKAQKVVVTVWIILIAFIFLVTNPFGYWADISEFIGMSLIISIPAFILLKVWGDKK